MEKRIIMEAVVLLTAVSMAGCGTGGEGSQQGGSSGGFDASRMIHVISREDGSGTRGAFVELFGIEEKKDDGTKVDNTTKEAVIAKATDVMMTTVSGDPHAIGYVSLGSLNDSVKALEIDGTAATADNVKAGTYKIARPFNIAAKGDPTGLTKDFIEYIMSAEGQQVIADNGYIKVEDGAPAYTGGKQEGKIVVAGSSSVTPVMEKLAEAYQAINPRASIEIQQSDSTAGMTAVMDGTCDIGMASRELRDTEAASLTGMAIASDGIAVIVSPNNPLDGLTSANIKDIYTGTAATWDAVTVK